MSCNADPSSPNKPAKRRTCLTDDVNLIQSAQDMFSGLALIFQYHNTEAASLVQMQLVGCNSISFADRFVKIELFSCAHRLCVGNVQPRLAHHDALTRPREERHLRFILFSLYSTT